MTGFEYDNTERCIGDEWKDVVSDPIHGRDDVPKSWKRMGMRITPQGGGSEPAKVTIHPKTTDNPEQWITSDTWMDAEAME